MLRVLLVNPDSAAQGDYSNPPLGLAYLAGTLEHNGIPVKIVDGYLVGRQGILREIREYEPDLVGITCYTPGRSVVFDIARSVKSINKRTVVVLGGAHPTIMWKQILSNLPQVDLCVLGEGEQTLLEIASGKPWSEITGIAWRNEGNAVRNGNRRHAENLDEIPFPAWHLLPLHQYPARGSGVHNGVNLAVEPRISVVFSRGCVGHCDFCSTWWIWRGYRCRSAANMVDELEVLNKEHGVRHICFADDAFGVDVAAAKQLCHEILRRGLRIAWFATARVDCVDEELLRAMREAGCYEVSYGVESGSQRILEAMGKQATVERARDAIRMTKAAGLRATALMIVGNVGETVQSINETVDFLREANPDSIGTVGGLWVLPGTALYRKAKQEGKIEDSYWLTDQEVPVYYGGFSALDLFVFRRAVIYREKYWAALVTAPLMGLAKTVYYALRSLVVRLNRRAPAEVPCGSPLFPQGDCHKGAGMRGAQ